MVVDLDFNVTLKKRVGGIVLFMRVSGLFQIKTNVFLHENNNVK